MQEEIEKILQDTGVTELMEQKVKEMEAVATTETPIPTTEPTTTPAATPETPAVVTTEKEQTPEDDIWKDITPTTTEVTPEVDWKIEAEKEKQARTELVSKIEKFKAVKDLIDVLDSPDFVPEKFFEAHAPKGKIDYNQFSVENLYKQSLADDQIAGYTAEEIDAKWEKKRLEIEEDPTVSKDLKSRLIREFQAKEPQAQETESEFIKEWKQAKENQRVQFEKIQQEQEQVKNEISQFAKSVIGKKIAGFVITEEHAKALEAKTDPNTYRTKDGKLSGQLLGQDRLKAALFDPLVKYLLSQNKTEAVIEARKEITKPNPNPSGGSPIVNVDDKDEATKIIEQGMGSMGLATDLVLTK